MTRTRLTLAVVLALAFPLSGWAQESDGAWGGRAFVNFNAGVQTASPNFRYQYSTVLFDEMARAGIDIPGKTGMTFDVGGGVRLVQNLGVGVTYSRYSKERTATLSTTIPSPFDYGQASTIERQLPLQREEDAVHFQAIYRIPITNKVHVGVFGGPSYFRCLDDVVSQFALGVDSFFPAWAVNFSDVTQTVDKESVWGYHGGVDVTYLFTRRFGVGTTMRYSRASHHSTNHFADTGDLFYDGVWGGGNATETVTMDHGGFHWNGGVNLRF